MFYWKRGRREMEYEQVRGWRGGGMEVVLRKVFFFEKTGAIKRECKEFKCGAM